MPVRLAPFFSYFGGRVLPLPEQRGRRHFLEGAGLGVAAPAG